MRTTSPRAAGSGWRSSARRCRRTTKRPRSSSSPPSSRRSWASCQGTNGPSISRAPGLDRLIHAGYRLLGLQTFFTVGENEVRAWTMHRGGTAFDAAGEIHSDFQRGFIRAETVSFADFARVGSYKAAREQGLVRSEGRDYLVQDGDILLFRFNV